MIDVLFITPTTSPNVLKESVGTMILATILREQGIGVEILPFGRFGNLCCFEELVAQGTAMILEKKPRILSFYTRCDCYHTMLEMARRVKEQWDCKVVLGGPQSDITAEETLEEIPYVDYVCRGEGESTVYPFFSSLLAGQPDHSVRGLVYRQGDKVCANPKPELIADLDSLPVPDYSGFHEGGEIDPKICFSIDAGRGCPFGCTYCSTKTFWGRKYRLKSPKRLVQELKYFHDQFGVTYFSFQHDMFTMNREQVIETCRLIRELDFRVKWNCSARSDCIDEELVRIMAESGLNWLYLGIETGSPRMQKLVNKNLKLDKVLPQLEYIGKYNVRVLTSFIYGFPQETEEDLSQTLSLMIEMLKMKHVQVQAHLCAFLPGTALGEEYRDRLTPSKHISDQAGAIGLEESADFIAAHPRLFMQTLDFHTELRDRLQHFILFLSAMDAQRHIYLHLAKQYAKETMIQMYFDFVEAYSEILNDESATEIEKLRRILANGALAEKYVQSPCRELICDFYRMERLKAAVARGQSKGATDIFCFSPLTLQESRSLEDCPLGWSMVSFSRNPDGSVQTTVRSMG